MKPSFKTAKLGAVLAALLSIGAAAAPASADTYRGDYDSAHAYAPAASISVRFDAQDHRYGPPRFARHREMIWREMMWRHAHRHFHDYRGDARYGEHFDR